MSTIINQFEINGRIDTNNTVLDNINLIAQACGSYVTFDPSTGKWSVIINEAGSSVRSFDDSTILGAITVSGSGINELFNSCEVLFPHADLRDDEDSVRVEVVGAERYPNELDNTLTIRQPLINNPIQAEYLANIELKQSRQDKVINFRSDYSALELKAGDIIDITSTIHNYTNKLFRIVTLVEIDTDQGGIECEITAIEYDPDVYASTGLVREERSKVTGIPAGEACPEIQTKEATSDGKVGGNLLNLNQVFGSGDDERVEYRTGVTLPPPNSAFDIQYLEETPYWTAPYDGTFNLLVNADQNSSGAQGRASLVPVTNIIQAFQIEYKDHSDNLITFTQSYMQEIVTWGNYKQQTDASGNYVDANAWALANPNTPAYFDSLGNLSDYVQALVILYEYDPDGNPTGTGWVEASGGYGAWYWTDFVIPIQFPAKKDHIYVVAFGAIAWTPDDLYWGSGSYNPAGDTPMNPSNWTLSFQIFSADQTPNGASGRDISDIEPELPDTLFDF